MKMFGRDGRLHDVPDHQVQAAFLSGQYGFAPGSTVPVVTQEGQIGDVPAEQAQAAFHAGASIAPAEQYQKAVLQRQYGGLGGAAIAGAEGAARGATAGLSDPLAVAAGGLVAGAEGEKAVRKHLESYREANPISAGVGEVAGMVAPALATGGTSAVAEGAVEGANLARAGAEAAEGAGLVSRAAGAAGITEAGAQAADGSSLLGRAVRTVGAPVRAISSMGELAERATAAAIGEGSERAVVRVAQKLLSKGVQYGAEGALYGAGQQISEDTLGDTDTTAEKLYAAAGHGAVAGFLLGGLGGAGEEIAKYGLAKASPGLTSLAETQAVRALNPLKKHVAEMEAQPGGTKALGRWLLDNGVVAAGDDVEAVAAKVQQAKRAAGEKLDDVLSTLDNHALEKPDGWKIFNRITKEAIEPLAQKPGFEAIGKSVANLRDSFLEKAVGVEGYQRVLEGKGLPSEIPLGFKQLRDMRASIDDLLYRESSPLAKSPRDTELRKIRSIIEDELEKTADKASAQIGGNVLEDYKAAKLDYRRAALADKITEQAVNAKLANRAISLSDYGIGVGAIASGHPMGLLASVAHKAIREHGNATAAALLDKVSSIAAMARETKAINRQIDRGVESYVHGEKVPVPKKLHPYRDIEPGEKMRDTYDRKVKEVADAAARLEKQKSAMQGAMTAIAGHAPKVAAAVARMAEQTTKYLAAKVPRQPAAGPSLQPQFDKPRVSDADAASFLRQAQIVEDPMSVFDELHRGTLTREHVEALKANYPRVYEQLVSRSLNEVKNTDKPLPYDRLLQMRLLLGIQTDKTLSPQFVQTMQQTFKKAGGAPKPPQMAPKRPVTGIAEGMQLSLDRAIARRR